MNKKAIVIGSGFGGIAVSLRLQKLGYETTIIEKLNELGGRARVFKVNGYKHDAGPTVITAHLMNYLVYLIKKGNHLICSIEPWYRYYFMMENFDYCSTIEKQI